MNKTIKKISALLACLFLVLPLGAQSADDDDDEKNIPVYRQNEAGDQAIRVTIAFAIPIKPDLQHMKLGGEISLGYTRILQSLMGTGGSTMSMGVGGGISFENNGTVGKNSINIFSFMAHGFFQPSIRQFEFPIYLSFGGSLQNYLARTVVTMAFRGEVGAMYRINTGWSVGIHGSVLVLPEIYSKSSGGKNYTGVIATAGASARYHF